ncbi:MAG TPA: hypothetical protein VIP05_21485 [Burkholderiaceae bacterium]
MFLPEIYMHLHHLHAATRHALPGAERDDAGRPAERRLSDAAQPPASAPPAGANEWDEWKSVRDLA